VVGDGECSEGQIWEAVQFAAKYELNNILVIVDNNRMTLDGPIDEIMPALKNLPKIWKSFGWNVAVCKGHSIAALKFNIMRSFIYGPNPNVVIANTIKGKGISCMEDRHEWHVGALTEEQARQALKETGRGSNERNKCTESLFRNPFRISRRK
jgi:transketolase